MESMNRHFVAVVALASLLTPQVGLACRCVPPPPPDKAFEQAVVVFVGTVQDIEQTAGGAAKLVTLTVEQAWKGLQHRQPKVTVTTCANGACCGYGFQEKESYLVYAYGEGKSLSVSLCSRTQPLANADEDIAVLNKIVAGERIAAPPRPQPAPAPEVAAPVADGNGLTVGLQDAGMSVVAIHAASGKMIWKLKMQGPAGAVRVEGNRVIVLPQNWVVDLATGKVISQ
jgi:hypothetical protein